MLPRIGWGVVGCGWVACDFVIPAIRASRNGVLVAACDQNAATLPRGDGSLLATTDLNELLACQAVGAVYVATPNHLHRPIVEAAARAGKAVLCEKPMATTAADAAALLAACDSAGVLYATAFDQRFHAAHRQLQQLVRAGALGTVTQARVHYACWVGPDWAGDNWRADPKRAGGGAMIDLAPHAIDLLEVILGEEWVELISLRQNRVHDYAVDDGAVLMGRLQSGTLATIQVAYNCPETYPRRTLELIGTRARALCENTMGQTPGGRLTITDAATGTDSVIALEDDRSPFLGQVEAFVDAVMQHTEYPYPGSRDLRLMQLLETSCR